MVLISGYMPGTYMYSLASNIDKDPYEVKCHTVFQCVRKGGDEGGLIGDFPKFLLRDVFPNENLARKKDDSLIVGKS